MYFSDDSSCIPVVAEVQNTWFVQCVYIYHCCCRLPGVEMWQRMFIGCRANGFVTIRTRALPEQQYTPRFRKGVCRDHTLRVKALADVMFTDNQTRKYDTDSLYRLSMSFIQLPPSSVQSLIKTLLKYSYLRGCIQKFPD
jgi:hypothetical protein